MTPERWQYVKQVLAAALQLPPDEQLAYLDQSYNADSSLRDEVESLIASEKKRGDFLDSAYLAAAAVSVIPADEAFWAGRRVGPYKVVEQIGSGGMGEVYRAFRADDQYRKEVALKFVRAGQYSSTILARFKNERQILAGFDHPNLAKLLDGGTTENGMPYLVMELIEGQSIAQYCKRHNLSISARLRLFSQICEGVHYAHQRLIIHRDIKPGNILVTSEGIPKLLDFGIAKILEADPGETLPERTLTSFQVLTPQYASPEQVKGEAMTTATDVYSLGVVLYELLSGVSPYGTTNESPHEVVQAVIEREPLKPSLAILQSQGGCDSNAEEEPNRLTRAMRDTARAKLNKRLRGDLDNIVLMALRKEPARRYASVKDLQEDIRRHLESFPVIARNDTVWYRTAKFLARRKASVAAFTIAVLAIVTGLTLTQHEAHVAQVERARAERRFNDVRNLANSLMFEVHDSIRDLPGSTPARKLLISRAIKYLDSLALESNGDASLQAELANAYEKIGKVQGGDFGRANLGDNEGALASFRKMLAIRQNLASANPTDVENQIALARGYRAMGDLQAVYLADLKGALGSCSKALAITEPLSKSNPTNEHLLRELAADYEKLGDIQGGGNGSSANLADPNAAVRNHIRSQALVQKLAEEAPTDRYLQRWLAVADYKLQNELSNSDFLDEAKLRAKEAFEIFEGLTNQEDNASQKHDVAAAYDALANLEVRQGRYDHALRNYREEVKLLQPCAAADPQNTEYAADLASARANLGYMVCRTGNCKRGVPLLTSAFLSISRIDTLGKNAQIQAAIAGIATSLADSLGRTGRRNAAAEYYSRAKQIYQQIAIHEPMDLNNQMMLAGLENARAAAYGNGLRFDSAVKAYKESLAISVPAFSNGSGNLKSLYSALRSYAGLGDTEAALAGRDASSPRKREHWNEARQWYEKSLDVARRLPHKQPVDPSGFESPDTRTIVSHLAYCNRQLAATK